MGVAEADAVLGYVLAARSGVWGERCYKDRLAWVAALDTLPGRQWRPLVRDDRGAA